MTSQMRQSTSLSRRTFAAGSTGQILGTAGLLLPAPGDAADARDGADGGKLGGRHGKNHRGRNKQRNDNDDSGRDEVRHQNLGLKNVALGFYNGSDHNLVIKVVAWNNQDFPRKTLSPGSATLYQSGGEWIKAGFSSGGSDIVHVQAVNRAFGEPYVEISDDFGTSMDPYLSENEEFLFTEKSNGNTYNIKRGNDTDDFKMFYVTAVAVQ